LRNLISNEKDSSDQTDRRTGEYPTNDPKTKDMFEDLDMSLDEDGFLGLERGASMLKQIQQNPEYVEEFGVDRYAQYANMALDSGNMSESTYSQIMQALGTYFDNTAMQSGKILGTEPVDDPMFKELYYGAPFTAEQMADQPDIPAGFPTPNFIGGTPGGDVTQLPLTMSDTFGRALDEPTMFDVEWNKLPGATQYAMRRSKDRIQRDAELLFRVYNPGYAIEEGTALGDSFFQNNYSEFLRTYISGGSDALDERYGGGQNFDSRIDDILATMKDYDATGTMKSGMDKWYYAFHPNSGYGQYNYDRLSDYLSTQGLGGTFADDYMRSMVSDMRNRALETGESPSGHLNTIVSMRKASAGGK
jgi:hypothetical protein